MRLVFGLVLIVGVALAGFAVYMTRGYLAAYQAELSRERAARQEMVQTEEVYVATRALKYGEVLTREDVKSVRFPLEAMPEGAFKLTPAEDEPVLFGEDDKPRIVLRTMEPMEALMVSKVTEPGRDAGVASRLGVGMRAFAIKVDVTSGVSGFLSPGDRVDIYWTGKAPTQLSTIGSSSEVTKLIDASVQIIAVDQLADSERNNPTIARTITVEATPQQVAALAQAQSSGRLSLSLVGYSDETVSAGVEVDQNSLLGIEEAEVVQLQKERVCTIKTRKSGEVLETVIPCRD
ncbi:hypothetical protein AQS8620_01076 [Aquimixticola soesokkakensis]|uniref:SAF domain-containing protein n=1 Tax=Aquimixticola soesokkakensis TaxID=1519096 RepID=A0A1Y5S4B6_9RHOB|nr:Flp pilus assembly protein CpaB [Aquimixticola soesokkakensis]SLN32304.1 hypothetical protein AQS8620_01076 [Aquimixticola soesokkakensis]